MAETMQIQSPGIGWRSQNENSGNGNKRSVDMWDTANRSTLRARPTKAELIASSGYGNNLTHKPGHDAIRSVPETTIKAVTGEIIKLEGPPKFSQELVAHFTHELQNELEKLINMRERIGSYDAFAQRVRDSGHEYYLDLFENLTKDKEGTNGRIRDVDVKALKEFMSKDSNLEIAVEIAQKRLQEEALAEAKRLSVGPSEGPDGQIEDEDTLIKGGNIGHRVARRVGRWARTPLGVVNGRPDPDSTSARLFINRGRITMVLGGTSIVLGGVGGVVGLLGGPMGSLIGASVGAALPEALAGLRHAFKRGESLNIDISADALRAIIGDPTSPNPQIRAAAQGMNDWMHYMRNVTPEDSITNGNTITPKDRLVETRMNRQQRRERLASQAEWIIKYQEANGVPANLRRPDTATWLLEGSLGNLRAPQHGTDFETRTMALFNPNRGGLRDINGNAREVPQMIINLAGQQEQARDANGNPIWRRNPNFCRDNSTNPPRVVALDIVGNMRRYQEAESKALGEMVNQAFQDIIDGKTDYKQRILDDIQKLRGDSGNEAQNEKKKADHEKKKVALEGDKTNLTGMSDALSDFQTSLVSSQIEVGEAEHTATEAKKKVEIKAGTMPAGSTNTEVEALSQVLSAESTTAMVIVDGQEIGSLVAEGRKLQEDLTNEVNKHYNAERTRVMGLQQANLQVKLNLLGAAMQQLASLTEENQIAAQQDIVKAAQGEVRAAEAEIKENKELLQSYYQMVRDELKQSPQFEERFRAFEEKKTLIRELRQEIIDANRDAHDKQRDASRGEIPGQEEAGKTVTSMGSAFEKVVTGLGIPEADLQAGKTFDELMTDINNSGQADAWPVGENTDAANRTLLLQAMAEARARNTRALTTEYSDVAKTVSDVDILKLTPDQIKTRLDSSVTLGIDEIKTVKAEVESRMKARQDELKKLIKDREREARKPLKLDAEKLTSAHLDALQALVTNYGGIREGIMALTDTSPGGALDRFLSVELIDTIDTAPTWKKGKNRTLAEDNIYKLLFAKAPRSAEHTDSSGTVTNGPEGADAVQRDILKEEDFVKLAIKRFQLQNIPEFNMATTPPSKVTDNPPQTIEAVIRLLRRELGLSSNYPTYMESELRPAGTITRGQLASFLSETIIFGHIAPQVHANV